MFSPLRNRFGIPGVISVIALVFAMLGGAYAASNSGGSGKATASAKAKRGPRGPKGATGPAGPAGAAGAQGPAGSAGEKGADGAKGATGATGANGQSVTTTAIGPFGECGEQEGVKLTSASGNSKVCDGAEGPQGAAGSPWTAGGTLPAGSTETGDWVLADQSPVVGLPGFESNYTVISFPVPLASGLEGEDTFYVGQSETVPAQCDNPAHAGAPSAFNPEADPGELCVFTYENVFAIDNPNVVVISADGFVTEGTSVSGAFLSKSKTTSGFLAGSWAVTG